MPFRGVRQTRGRNVTKIEFDAKLVGRGPVRAWVFLDFPRAVSQGLPSRNKVAVRGTMNGFPFRTSTFPIGDGIQQIAVNKKLQAGAKAGAGDRVHVVLEVDTKPRLVRTPPDLKAALAAAAKAHANYEELSYTHRKGYVDWITEAKRPETRDRRVREAVRRLSKGKGYFYE